MDYKKHEELKNLCIAVYNNKNTANIKGWKYLKCASDNTTGFFCEIYKKDKNYALVIRGTDTKTPFKFNDDLYADKQLFFKKLPLQIISARTVYNNLKKDLKKDEKIILTGHSLGGSLAEILGTETGVETVSFNAYGVNNINGIDIKYKNNIINYGSAHDLVFVYNIDNHIGKTIILNNLITQTDELIKSPNEKEKSNKNFHKLELLGDLSKGIEYSDGKYKTQQSPLFQLSAEYNNYDENIFELKNRVLYKDEINSNEKDEKLINAYIKQFLDNNNKMPTKEELNKRVYIGNLIYVNSYTRSDGTVVSGYYRAYPR